jgi:hypothetical protein
MSKKPNIKKPRPSKATVKGRAKRKEVSDQISAQLAPILDKLALGQGISFEEHDYLKKFMPKNFNFK